MLRPSESLSSVKSAVTRPCSDERDVLAAGMFLAVALPPLMTCSAGEAIGRLLAVSVAEEGFCFALLWARGSPFSRKRCVGRRLHVPCTTPLGSGVSGQSTQESVNYGRARMGIGTQWAQAVCLIGKVCRNNSDRPEHWSRRLDAALRSGLLPPGFTRPVFHTDVL